MECKEQTGERNNRILYLVGNKVWRNIVKITSLKIGMKICTFNDAIDYFDIELFDFTTMISTQNMRMQKRSS